MADTLKDVVAALCQVARDYSLARLRSDPAAAENWRTVFSVVLDARLNQAGRGAALAAFRAERCPGVDRQHADELAPPPHGTESLSSSTLRWLADLAGVDLASELPTPAQALEAYQEMVEARPGLSAAQHAEVAQEARRALSQQALPSGDRVDVPLSTLKRMVKMAEDALLGVASSSSLMAGVQDDEEPPPRPRPIIPGAPWFPPVGRPFEPGRGLPKGRFPGIFL